VIPSMKTAKRNPMVMVRPYPTPTGRIASLALELMLGLDGDGSNEPLRRVNIGAACRLDI